MARPARGADRVSDSKSIETGVETTPATETKSYESYYGQNSFPEGSFGHPQNWTPPKSEYGGIDWYRNNAEVEARLSKDAIESMKKRAKETAWCIVTTALPKDSGTTAVTVSCVNEHISMQYVVPLNTEVELEWGIINTLRDTKAINHIGNASPKVVKDREIRKHDKVPRFIVNILGEHDVKRIERQLEARRAAENHNPVIQRAI